MDKMKEKLEEICPHGFKFKECFRGCFWRIIRIMDELIKKRFSYIDLILIILISNFIMSLIEKWIN